MARTRVRWRRVAGLALGVALVVGVAGGAAHAGAQDEPSALGGRERTYVVREGDTLWAIAIRIAGPTADPRPLVDELAVMNQTSGALVAGETLRIPGA
jgi:hypothetical protein